MNIARLRPTPQSMYVRQSENIIRLIVYHVNDRDILNLKISTRYAVGGIHHPPPRVLYAYTRLMRL